MWEDELITLTEDYKKTVSVLIVLASPICQEICFIPQCLLRALLGVFMFSFSFLSPQLERVWYFSISSHQGPLWSWHWCLWEVGYRPEWSKIAELIHWCIIKEVNVSWRYEYLLICMHAYTISIPCSVCTIHLKHMLKYRRRCDQKTVKKISLLRLLTFLVKDAHSG